MSELENKAEEQSGLESYLSLMGTDGFRYILRNAIVLSMDPKVGNFEKADMLIEGKKIIEIKPRLEVEEEIMEIEVSGKIVMPGFIDTHHHLYESTFSSFFTESLLAGDGRSPSFFETMRLKFTPLYRPEDIYISLLVSGLNQLERGITTSVDLSQVGYTKEHIDAVYNGLKDSGRRSVMAFMRALGNFDPPHPQDIYRLKKTYFNSDDQLLSLAMGSEMDDPEFRKTWAIARDLKIPIASHYGSFLKDPKALVREGLLGPDNMLAHCTELDDETWKAIADTGAHVSITPPVSMSIGIGMPPIMKAMEYNAQISLCTDTAAFLSSDMFDQMKSAYSLQRGLVNQRIIEGKTSNIPLLTTTDVIRMATIEGAKAAQLDKKTGSLTPGKEADLLILRTQDLNTMPMNNVPAAIVSLMDRQNIETVMVAGSIRKWKGALLDVDIAALNDKLAKSRDYIIEKSGVDKALF